MASIDCVGISKTYANGFSALAETTLHVAAGSMVVILGSSGAGKSTLMRCINGLEQPSTGHVALADEILTKRNLRRVRARVGMVFQHFNLISRLNVMTNVLCGRLSYRSWLGSSLYLFRREDLAIASHALERVGLIDKAWSRADTLSGGQQQRVGIARALAQQPRILLADEPVASLDEVTGMEILTLLRTIRDQDGLTCLVNLHQVELARAFADRIVGINAGRVVFDDAPAALSDAALAAIYQRPAAASAATAASTSAVLAVAAGAGR
jgi:phosphonate transport system ATP-binding protein